MPIDDPFARIEGDFGRNVRCASLGEVMARRAYVRLGTPVAGTNALLGIYLKVYVVLWRGLRGSSNNLS